MSPRSRANRSDSAAISCSRADHRCANGQTPNTPISAVALKTSARKIVRRSRALRGSSNTERYREGLVRAITLAESRTGGQEAHILESIVAIQQRNNGRGIARPAFDLPLTAIAPDVQNGCSGRQLRAQRGQDRQRIGSLIRERHDRRGFAIGCAQALTQI